MADVRAKSVAEIKAMEVTVGEAREAAKTAMLASVEALVADLWQIGYEYRLVAVEGTGEAKKARVCGKCGGENHTARTCSQKGAAA